MILLDTNALLWLAENNKRSRPLSPFRGRLYVSPATVLEAQLLLETGRYRFRTISTLAELIDDARWLVDEVPSIAWFERARGLSWTQDPFDRLIVAHALCRGWKLATGDGPMAEQLGSTRVLVL